MNRTVAIAAVQMDVDPTPIPQRLNRAGRLAAEAAHAGAQLVVLPELFNTGYTYSQAVYRRAEPLHGPTVNWMKETAARQNVHLAGSLLLLDRREIYNALLLFAPDGRMWRYNKTYPAGWERAFFRGEHRITIAETDLGRIGMLICWDVAHLDLWQRYAGRVDLMLICSCPPDISNPTFHFPSGAQVTYDDMGPVMASLKGVGQQIFGQMLHQQVGWLGTPAVNTVGTGQVRTQVPSSWLNFLTFLPLAPRLVRYLPQAGRMELSSDMVEGCKVMGADGGTVSALTQEQGEAFAVAEVSLADRPPRPSGPQPASPITPFAYFCLDTLLPGMLLPTYRREVRRAWGREMAPFRLSPRQWTALIGLGTATGFLLGWLRGRRVFEGEK